MNERLAEILEDAALWLRRRFQGGTTRATVYIEGVDDEDWTASNVADALRARGYNPMRVVVNRL